MDIDELRDNFTSQLKSVEDQIKSIKIELNKAKEYRLKLKGGLETISLLDGSKKLDSYKEE